VASEATAGAEEQLVIYSRSTAKLTLAGLTVFTSALAGAGLGLLIANKAQNDPDVPEHKRGIVRVRIACDASLR